jgi:hypothetical protein
MASRLVKALITKGTHSVGSINSWKIRTLPYGAIIDTADVDNFTIVELGFNANGERIAKQLSNKTTKGYLIAAPERRYVDGEQMCDFYNEVGEAARIIFLELGVRFETSAFTLNAGVTDLINGQVAHFDVTTKKFIISTAGTAHADYATSANQFLVVANDDETMTIDGQTLVRLEVTK